MKKYLVFITVSISLLTSALSITSISVAFPVITTSFNVSIVVAGWVLTGYQLMTVISMSIAGRVSELISRKTAFLLSLLIFSAGSLICAFAPGIQTLVLGRVVQGLGVGAFMPVSAGIVAAEFPKSRQQLIGLFSSIFPVGQVIGPNIGGWLIYQFGWRSIFWLNLPFTVTAFIVACFVIRQDSRHKGRLDLAGAGLLAASLSAILFGLAGFGAGQNMPGPIAFGLILCGLALAALFLRQESKEKEPIINIEILRRKPFLASNLYNFFFGSVTLGIYALVPLFAVSLYGMSTLESGVLLTPRSIMMFIGSTVTAIMLMRWGYRWPMLIGTFSCAMAMIILALEPGRSGGAVPALVFLLASMFLAGFGPGIASPASNNACIDLMPDKAATITGVRSMSRQTGGLVAVGITTLILENSPGMAIGFNAVFLLAAALMLVTIPIIYIMPRSPIPIEDPGAAKTRRIAKSSSGLSG